MKELLFEGGIILLLIIVNGILALAEMAVVTSRRTRLESDAEHGDVGAAAAIELIESPNLFLSTVQIGITVIGIVAGVYGGATFAAHLGGLLDSIWWVQPYGHQAGLFLIVLGITYFSLVLGELVPKRIAISRPEAIAKVVSPALRLLARVAAPIVWILDRSTNAFLTLFGIKAEADEKSITEEDIVSMVEQGSEEGVIEETESEIVSKVFRLGDRSAGSLMTPRRDVVWLDATQPIETVWPEAFESNHSHFPLARGSLDNIIGVASFRDLVQLRMENGERSLESISIEPLRIPNNVNALLVLEQFREAKCHLALVFDEHGVVDGVVTLHDLLEALVGTMNFDGEKDWFERPDGSLLTSAAIDLLDLFELLELDESEKEIAPGYHSLGGLIFHKLGHIPREGEICNLGRYRLEVIDMDGMRIDKVLITEIVPVVSEAG